MHPEKLRDYLARLNQGDAFNRETLPMKLESDGSPHSNPLPGTEGILFAVRGDARLTDPFYRGIQLTATDDNSGSR